MRFQIKQIQNSAGGLPFIIAGTLAAAIAFVGLSFVDNAQARALNGVERFETAVYGTIADADAQNDDIKGIFDNAVSTVFNNSLNQKTDNTERC